MTSKAERREPLVIMMHSTDFVCLSESTLLERLTSRDYRSSLLVTCRDLEIRSVTRHLMTWCAPPFHVRSLPGALSLPSRRYGTLFLEGVSALSLGQQMDVDDWVTAAAGNMQIVSITQVPLRPLVDNGRFLEGLFYRLNVVSLEAKPDKKVGRRTRERVLTEDRAARW